MEEQENYSARTILIDELNRGIRQLRSSAIIYVIWLLFYFLMLIIKYSRRIYSPPWSISLIGFYPASEATMYILFILSNALMMISYFIYALSLIRISNILKTKQVSTIKAIGIFVFGFIMIELILTILQSIFIVIPAPINIAKFFFIANYLVGFFSYLIPVLGILFIGLYFKQLRDINGYRNGAMFLPIVMLVLIFVWGLIVTLMYSLPSVGFAWVITEIVFECLTAAVVLGSFLELFIKTYMINTEEIINYRLKLG